MPNAIVSWSGGKDSCFAAMQVQKEGYAVKGFLNILSEEGKTSRAHGIPLGILQAQAAAAQFPLLSVAASWTDYEQKFTQALLEAKEAFNISHVVFGDIDLEGHREWEEKVCRSVGLQAVLPLWKKERKALVLQMIDEGMQMLIVSCNERLGENLLGRYLTTELVQELEALGIDPCGEEGEFHTLVTDCKMFQKPFGINITDTYCYNGYWYAKLELRSSVVNG